MSLSTKKILFSAMASLLLLSACQPAQPTQNPIDVANQVATSVALTVAAQNALTQAAPSPVPQATNIPYSRKPSGATGDSNQLTFSGQFKSCKGACI